MRYLCDDLYEWERGVFTMYPYIKCDCELIDDGLALSVLEDVYVTLLNLSHFRLNTYVVF